MEIVNVVRDFGLLVVGVVLSGLLGILWKDMRDQREKLSAYVKIRDCEDRRKGCGVMREAMEDIVEAHTLSLQSMQEIFRNQTECLARLDERVAALKDSLARVHDELKRLESRAVS